MTKNILLAIGSVILPFVVYANIVEKSNVIIDTIFENGEHKQSLGMFISNSGMVVTHFKNIFDEKNMLYAYKIFIKIQENKNSSATCFSTMNIIAANSNIKIAILKPKKFTNIFCQNTNNAYHDTYLKRNIKNIKLNYKEKSINTKVFFPKIKASGEITTQSQKTQYFIYNNTIKQYISIKPEASSYLQGGGIFDSKGQFVGLIGKDNKQEKTQIINKSQVVKFICDTKAKGVIKQNIYFCY